MAYTKTVWVNNSEPPISAANLNNIENGIETNDTSIGDLSLLETTENASLVGAINELKNNSEWTYLGVTTGNNQMTLPNEWKELHITSTFGAGIAYVVDYYILKEDVLAGRIHHRVGFHMTTTNNYGGQISFTNNGTTGYLSAGYFNSNDITSSQTTHWYYR